ncbi:MAG: hypothetical protein PVG07_09870, partial [Acidobacteriota bacterium]
AMPRTIYAGTRRFVYRSDDGGATWRSLGGDLPGSEEFEARVLAVAPSDPSTLFAAGRWHTEDGGPDLFKTTDGGEHWERPYESGLQAELILDLAVDPADPDVVYLADSLRGVRKSVDGGRTWAPVNDGLPHRPAPEQTESVALSRIVIDPGLTDTLFVAVDSGGPDGPGGVYRSTDGGKHWARAADGLPEGLAVRDLAIDPRQPDRLWAATDRGLFVSEDAGLSWAPPERRLPSAVTAVAPVVRTGPEPPVFDPERPALFAGTRDVAALQRSEAGDWTPVDGWTDRGGLRVVDLALAPPENPRSLFLSSGRADPDPGPGGISVAGLFRAEPGNDSWELLGDDLSPFPVGLVLARGATPGAGTQGVPGPGAVYVSTSDGLWVSRDGGESWTALRERGVESLAWSDAAPLLLLAGTETPPPDAGPEDGVPPRGGILRSVDGGATWTVDGLGLPAEHLVTGLAVDPRNPDRVLAGLSGDPARTGPQTEPRTGGLYVSRDGGATFRPASPDVPPRPVPAIRFDPSAPDVVYAATLGAGVYRSTDRGETWAPLGAPPGDGWVSDLGFTGPAGAGDLLAATRTGVFRWSEQAPGPPPPPGGPWLTDPGFEGFRFKVSITPPGLPSLRGDREPACLPETVCVSGAVPGRAEVFLRIVGPKPNGYLWPTLVKLTTSRVEVWIERPATGAIRYYELAGARPGFDELPGLFDRFGFPPIP